MAPAAAAGRADGENRWPKAVRRFADHVRQSGFEPVVEGDPGREWAIAVEGQHVRAVAVFGKRGGGTTKWLRGELTVDGEPRPLLPMEGLRELWDERELGITVASE